MDPKGLWQAVLGELEVTISRANFATWFRNTAIISNEDGHVVIGVPNIMVKNWLEKKFHSDIKATLSKMNSAVHTVEYKVGNIPAAASALSSYPGRVTRGC